MTTISYFADDRPGSSGDVFFTDDQRNQLVALMTRWRIARDTGGRLPSDEEAELRTLIDAELTAATARTAARGGTA